MVFRCVFVLPAVLSHTWNSLLKEHLFLRIVLRNILTDATATSAISTSRPCRLSATGLPTTGLSTTGLSTTKDLQQRTDAIATSAIGTGRPCRLSAVAAADAAAPLCCRPVALLLPQGGCASTFIRSLSTCDNTGFSPNTQEKYSRTFNNNSRSSLFGPKNAENNADAV